ncbi:MAG: hypothetical protein U9Q77_01545 [Candidatus Marinimicrobia bacterium]|nr:hypothetical protein [Candidatus Neomarinimicrobiota bacterium]
MPLLLVLIILGLSACKSDQDVAHTPVFSYELETVFEVEGRQGVATNGQIYIVSGSKALYQYSLEGELLMSNLEPFIDLEGPVNHLGDIAIHGHELYTGVENFTNGRGENIQIVIYDLETLTYKRSIPWEPASGQVEVCGIAIDGPRKTIWLADWLNGQYLYQYDLESGNYVGRVELNPVPTQIQGIMIYQDQLFLTADDGDADHEKHDHIYSITIPDQNESNLRQMNTVKTLDEFKRAGEVEGLCLAPDGSKLSVLMNRGTRIVQGVPQEFYPGYDREIHELYIYKKIK